VTPSLLWYGLLAFAAFGVVAQVWRWLVLAGLVGGYLWGVMALASAVAGLAAAGPGGGLLAGVVVLCLAGRR
jgi:hypothetical protein